MTSLDAQIALGFQRIATTLEMQNEMIDHLAEIMKDLVKRIKVLESRL